MQMRVPRFAASRGPASADEQPLTPVTIAESAKKVARKEPGPRETDIIDGGPLGLAARIAAAESDHE
jgi:hypothetical protein